MLKHGIWPNVMGSAVLHVVMLILFTRAITGSQSHTNVMETFIISPASVSAHATGQPMIPVAKATTAGRGLEAKRSRSGQGQNASLPAPVDARPQDSYRKSEAPVLKQVPAALGPDENVADMNDAPEALATSHIPGRSTGAQSTVTLPHGRQAMEEMSLGEAGAPRFLHRESPMYPFLARKLGKEGKVVLRLTLDERGGQKDLEIIEKAGFGFTEAAVQAIKKSSLSAAQKDGKPVVSRVLIPVKFVLRED